MSKYVKRKSEQLGMAYGTACHRLRKELLFSFLKKYNENICYQCGQEIINSRDLSIEHKIAWLDKVNAKELFWDLDNLAYSHLSCNIGAGRRVNKGQMKEIIHGTNSGYAYHKCRCDLCTKAHTKVVMEYR